MNPPKQNEIILDVERLSGLGYRGLTREQANELLSEMYNAAEEIVGLKLAKCMSEEELDEFEVFFDNDDSAGALDWLEKKLPDYRKTVHETIDALDQVLRLAAEETRQTSSPSRLSGPQSSGGEPALEAD